MRNILARVSIFLCVLLVSGCSNSSLGEADEWFDSIQGLWSCVGQCGMTQVRFVREGNLIKVLKAGNFDISSDSEVWVITPNGKFDDHNALLPVTITYFSKNGNLPGCLDAMEKGSSWAGVPLSSKQNLDWFADNCREKDATQSYTMKNGSTEKDKFVPLFLSESGLMKTPFEFSFIRGNTPEEAANVIKTFESSKAERDNYNKKLDDFVAKISAKGFRPAEEDRGLGAAPAAEPDLPDAASPAAPAAEAPRS